jgi:hypothetical protein
MEIIENNQQTADFFIPFNVPSSKNSKRIVNRKTSKGNIPFLIDSEITVRYRKNCTIIYRSFKTRFLQISSLRAKPLYVGFYFVRDSAREFDLHNAVQIVADMMVSEGLIPDDNGNEFVPVFLGFHKDPSNSGVYIRILNDGYSKMISEYSSHYKNKKI